MRVRPRMLAAASITSLVVGALSGVTAPEAQAAGAVLAPQPAVGFTNSIIMPTSTGFGWNEAKANQVVEVARRYEGFPYINGANGPYAFDCSSYTRHVYAQFGIYLPRLPDDQLKMGPVSPPPRPSLVISCGGLATSASTPETAGTSPRGTPNSESWRVATTAIPFTFVSFVNEGTSLNRDIKVVCRWKTSSGTLLFQSSHTSGHEPSHPAHRFVAR